MEIIFLSLVGAGQLTVKGGRQPIIITLNYPPVNDKGRYILDVHTMILNLILHVPSNEEKWTPLQMDNGIMSLANLTLEDKLTLETS